MFRLRVAMLAGSALALATTTAGAQGRQNNIPPGQMPPAGLCRVWIDGVPPGRQPRATDCATARAQAPANSRIIYGGQSQGRVHLDPRVGTAGQYDPRQDPNSSVYDPRYDRNSRVYDPRNTGTYDPRASRGGNDNGGYDPRNSRNGNGGVLDSRRSDKEREKWERKRERELEKAQRRNDKRWKLDKGDDDEDDDDNGDHGTNGNHRSGRGHGRGHGHGHADGDDR